MKEQDRLFAVPDFLNAVQEHYPELIESKLNHFGFLESWYRNRDRINTEPPSLRFVSMKSREFTVLRDAWEIARPPDLKWLAGRITYKGLINLKPPTDLLLYSNLIWELQPKTIIEFGSLQGGSALWFADQMQTLCGGGDVHSFDILDKVIHDRARTSQTHFHKVDLKNLAELDEKLLASLPHPWLVVDDAHCNLENLVPLMAKHMHKGDYYIWEDYFLKEKLGTPEAIAKLSKIADDHNLLVDVKYTDAFGHNVTCSPNGWLRKMS